MACAAGKQNYLFSLTLARLLSLRQLANPRSSVTFQELGYEETHLLRPTCYIKKKVHL